MTGNLDSNLVLAREALRAGDQDGARKLIQEAVRQNPRDHRLWLWLAALATKPQESLDYITQAESLAPGDPKVVQARRWAQAKVAAAKIPRKQIEVAIDVGEEEPRVEVAQDQAPPAVAVKKKANLTRYLLLALAVFLLVFTALIITGIVWNALRQGQNRDPVRAGEVINQSETAETMPALAEITKIPDAPEWTPTTTHEESQPAPIEIPSRANLIRPKNVLVSARGQVPTWTPTPRPTETPTPSPTPLPTFVSDSYESSTLIPEGVAPGERWIDVNLSTQTLVAYEGALPVFDSLVSTGTARHPTVTGQFRIWLRFRAQDMDGYRLGYDYYLRNVPFVQYFYYDYSLHGTFWHNNFGTPMSHGCVNLPTPAAEWLYNWADYGTLVNIHF